ncbi:MAG TPA: phosphotransferase family protein [Vineibacter sp.]|nr:phosphotransferase family protein [Vineibacter sp.]
MLVRRHFGDDCDLLTLDPMEEGHAGLTFGFSVRRSNGTAMPFVLKLAPFGVKRQGNTDVYRQAPLLRALSAAGLPAPRVPLAAADESDLGTPFIVMERLAGRTFIIWEPHASFDLAPHRVAALWTQAAAALARLHAFDWRGALDDWEQPRPLAAELAYWAPILAKAPDDHWLQEGRALADALAARIPDAGPVGVIHGDYQPGNLLFDNGRLTGIIDWELAGIGTQALDLGWLAMMADPRCWHANWQPHVGTDRDALIAVYEDARGAPVTAVDWFQALACYRMGAIACLNVRLHRTGRRVDALWDRFAPSIETLFARGRELVQG